MRKIPWAARRPLNRHTRIVVIIDGADIRVFRLQRRKLFSFPPGAYWFVFDPSAHRVTSCSANVEKSGADDADVSPAPSRADLEEMILRLEQTLDDVHAHAVILARAHQHYLNLDTPTAQHIGAIIRACRRVLPRLANVSGASEAAVRSLPPDESRLLELYRQKRAVDGGGAFSRTWDASEHYSLDLAIEEAEAALSRPTSGGGNAR